MAQKPLHFTKDGYRYHWGEDDPLCAKYLERLNSFEASKRHQISNFTKRKVIPTTVTLSENDRAPQLKLNEDRSRVVGDKGYSMVRATHGANRGKFYFEAHVDSMPENTATRIGWGQCYANLQAPLGYDHFGYSWRSRFGTKFHQARGKTFDKSGGYQEGDTIGCMIELPYANSKNHISGDHLPQSIKDVGIIINVKSKKDTSRVVLEEHDKTIDLNNMKPISGSKISFYKNGRFMGVAYEDIYEGFYYPTISLYKSCVVTVNFGPNFRYPPEKFNVDSKNHIGYQPTSELAQISILDNVMSDLIFVVSKEVDRSDANLNELFSMK